MPFESLPDLGRVLDDLYGQHPGARIPERLAPERELFAQIPLDLDVLCQGRRHPPCVLGHGGCIRGPPAGARIVVNES